MMLTNTLILKRHRFLLPSPISDLTHHILSTSRPWLVAHAASGYSLPLLAINTPVVMLSIGIFAPLTSYLTPCRSLRLP